MKFYAMQLNCIMKVYAMQLNCIMKFYAMQLNCIMKFYAMQLNCIMKFYAMQFPTCNFPRVATLWKPLLLASSCKGKTEFGGLVRKR
jgi:hypothetical protein